MCYGDGSLVESLSWSKQGLRTCYGDGSIVESRSLSKQGPADMLRSWYHSGVVLVKGDVLRSWYHSGVVVKEGLVEMCHGDGAIVESLSWTNKGWFRCAMEMVP